MRCDNRWSILSLLLAGLCLVAASCTKSDSTAKAPHATTQSEATASAPEAAASPAGTQPGPSASALTQEVSGQVIAVDPAAKTLTVQAGSSPIPFAVPDRMASALLDLRPGDQVTVRYSAEVDKNTAEFIQKG